MNVTLSDADYDDMHHALGRPAGPHVKPYRNHFCTGADTAQARRFEATGLWQRGRTLNAGRDVNFHVTEEGQRQVMAWLERRNAAAGLRRWEVSGDRLGSLTFMAKSAASARYSAYLEIADCVPDGFASFLRIYRPRVRLA